MKLMKDFFLVKSLCNRFLERKNGHCQHQKDDRISMICFSPIQEQYINGGPGQTTAPALDMKHRLEETRNHEINRKES